MKICHNCNYENSINSKFCRQCGTRLEQNTQERENLTVERETFECPECSSVISPKAKFCRNCGTKLQKLDERSASKFKESQHPYETTENIDKLRCKHGCGGALIKTRDPDVFKCEFCGSKYLVKRESGSLKIIKELERKVNHVEQEIKDVRNRQDTFIEIQKAQTELHDLENWYAQFINSTGRKISVVVLAILGVIAFLGIILMNFNTVPHELANICIIIGIVSLCISLGTFSPWAFFITVLAGIFAIIGYNQIDLAHLGDTILIASILLAIPFTIYFLYRFSQESHYRSKKEELLRTIRSY